MNEALSDQGFTVKGTVHPKIKYPWHALFIHLLSVSESSVYLTIKTGSGLPWLSFKKCWFLGSTPIFINGR